MPGFFITATGTDVGKTFVTRGLIHALRARGRTVSALKPVASGFDEANPSGSDPVLLLEALGKPLNQTELDAISPWRFKAPLSPDMAARKEMRRIDFEKLVAFCENSIAASDNMTLIEGIGGLMVPLNERFTVLDLMQRLGLPVILVSGTYLGALSHLLSALEVLKRNDLLPSAIVLNETDKSLVTVEDTFETLSHFCGSVPLLKLTWHPAGRSPGQEFANLIEALPIA